MGYNSIAWLPICAGLTVIGLILSYFVGRRRGSLPMLRGAAWSLLPLAVYLTGSVEMFWKIGVAIGDYASGFVFSPVKWAGLAVAGLAVILFAATRGRDRRRASREKAAGARRKAPGDLAGPAAAGGGATRPLPAPAPGTAKTPASADNDDMKEIEEILRKRGIG